MTRKQKIFNTAHREFGYSKLGAQHYAFEQGAEWADNNMPWELCTDNNYWSEDTSVITIVCYDKHIYTRETSPYGWNVFVKDGNAYKLDIKINNIK